MGTLIRYLMAFGVQLLWQRTGKSGATPPMRMPLGKNKSMPLPIIGPWQMMIALWLARQVWTIYGNQVKTKLQTAGHPVVNHVGNLLPDTGSKAGPTNSSPSNLPSTSVPAATNASPPASPAPTRAVPQYGTQPLDAAVNGSGNLPPGSLLHSLRKTE